MRQSRKLDHLKYSLALTDGPAANGFADFSLVHNCLPGLAFSTIELATTVAGVSLRHPVIINAITGGAADVTAINAQLAELARRTGAAMAVGSQYAALENPAVSESYQVVRSVNPDGVLFANLGAHATPDQAVRAVSMIGADAIQIHLNAAQELAMPEGDRDFGGYLENIAAIVAVSPVPVIVKEVGSGVAREQATALVAAGVKAIDTGGAGGTNFVAIEAARGSAELPAETLAWGIPTAVSAVEVVSVLPPSVDLIVSGGIRSPLDAVKALALGGRAVAIATPAIRLLRERGLREAVAWFESFLSEIRRYMLLVGAGEIANLADVPVVITGKSREWLTQRGIDTTCFARRTRC
ncbi:type 2 isopentenyl-diphosphate Delta-isomerase [Anaeroselena agilis]|uniref:Isopentenyl-diphosphate delta-isomerase n=1 Tax=Anaeroselena agilis TaxID=3063788 RepID=A0ABU3NWK9_9FIRM|nr:type 2 isopentenyl-diphosphate Delta-isomerase [Selenomonadales bacterium 4137-cl]